MGTETITATQESYRSNPDGAKGAPSVTGRLADGRAELSSGNYTWTADLPPGLGGTGSAPSPTQYILGALAGCAVVFMHDTLGPQLGMRIDDVTVTARCKTDARGLLGMDGVAPDLMDIELEISVSSPDGADQVEALERLWLERCPIYLAILKANSVSVRVTRAAEGGEHG